METEKDTELFQLSMESLFYRVHINRAYKRKLPYSKNRILVDMLMLIPKITYQSQNKIIVTV